jgi:4-carboxymuconolactone decarboxylase
VTVDRQRFEKGIAIRQELGMHIQPGPNTDRAFFEWTAAELFGTVFARPGLALRERELITLAVIIAIGGSHENLSNHFRALRTIGFTDSQVKEVIIQTMYYCGWPRGAAANQIYNRTRGEGAGTADAGDTPRHGDGARIREQMGQGAKPADQDDAFFALTTGELFGGVFARPGLSLRERAMIALASTIALGGTPDQLADHFRAVRTLGLSDAETRELIVQAMYYSGWPRGAAANQVYNRLNADGG